MFSLRSRSAEVMKRLTPGDVPGAVLVGGGLGAAGADVGAGVGLGQHHGGAPLALDHDLGDALVALVAVVVDDAGERRAGGVHPDRGVGAEHHLAHGPDEGGRGGGAAELLADLEAPVLGVHPGLVALLERLGHGGRVGLGVEDRRVAVAVDVRRGEVVARQAADLGEDLAGGVAVDLGEGTLAEDLVPAEHLEEVELDVAQVALVVAHDPPIPFRGTGPVRDPVQWWPSPRSGSGGEQPVLLLASNKMMPRRSAARNTNAAVWIMGGSQAVSLDLLDHYI